eukprot:265459-Pleurochrysis_carterae.AAC.1
MQTSEFHYKLRSSNTSGMLNPFSARRRREVKSVAQPVHCYANFAVSVFFTMCSELHLPSVMN